MCRTFKFASSRLHWQSHTQHVIVVDGKPFAYRQLTVLDQRLARGEFVVLAGRRHSSNPESIPREQLAAWEAQGLATWIGHCENMPGLLGSTSVVCLPSIYREGIPMALLEASSAGPISAALREAVRLLAPSTRA